MPEQNLHIVIVGGGFGGLYAAKALRKAPVSITLVDRRNHHLFQPLLYQVWALLHVLSLFGFRNRASVIFQWAWSYVTYQRGVRLITGEALRYSSPQVPVLLSTSGPVPTRNSIGVGMASDCRRSVCRDKASRTRLLAADGSPRVPA